MVTGAIIGGAAAIGGSLLSANAAGKASKQQSKAAKRTLNLQRDVFETTEANQQPFIESGQLGLQALLFELGLGDAPTIGGGFKVGDETFGTREEAEAFVGGFKSVKGTGTGRFKTALGSEEGNRPDRQVEIIGPRTFRSPTGQNFNAIPGIESAGDGRVFGGFQESPGFKFAKQQGIDAVDASAAGAGNLFSGNTLQALTEFGSGFASQQRGTFLDRLSGLVNTGAGSVDQLSATGTQFAAAGTSALGALGNAQSAGTIGRANAFQGGLNSLSTIAGSFGGFA